jgi:putative SOS response-associated peptidase YedK
MCGYIGNVTDSPLLAALLSALDMPALLPQLRMNPGAGPAALIDIVLGGPQPQVRQALWWLLLEAANGQWRPSRYTSFNTRWDKLDQPRSAGYWPYRKSRCLVPASYFIEGIGQRDQRAYHRIEPQREAFAFGGLYRTWIHRASGAMTYSCSIITLPAHPSAVWRRIHPQSTPLMLPADRRIVQRWLDPGFERVEAFAEFLIPRFRQPLRALPIARPSQQRPLGPPVLLDGDEHDEGTYID